MACVMNSTCKLRVRSSGLLISKLNSGVISMAGPVQLRCPEPISNELTPMEGTKLSDETEGRTGVQRMETITILLE